ncbi:MAG: hypothetical protein ACRD4M_01190 [Candidatus Acidiferrales bacterium]
MTKFKIFAAFLTAAAAIAFAAPAAHAQVDTSAPIVVKQTKPKPLWMKVEIIRADANQMVVREVKRPMFVHTFTYSQKAQSDMLQILNAGGYQTGDKVKILYQPGDTVALLFRGKPSKPI